LSYSLLWALERGCESPAPRPDELRYKDAMDVFPAFIPLNEARVVVVGDGEAAGTKARLFEGAPVELVRIPPERARQAEAYTGARLAFVAVAEADLAEEAAKLARAAGALVNVVDRPWLCDFHTPAIVDRTPVIAAIGTGGAAPVLATLLRNGLETRWPEGLGRVAALAGALQPTVRERIADGAARRAYWRRLLHGPFTRAAESGNLEEARRIALAALEEPRSDGRVLFLRPPARAELLSLAAVRAFAAADRVVAGPDAPAEVTAFARRDAERMEAATAAELAAWASEGLTVICLDRDEALFETVKALGTTAERLPVAE
jgi:precorrin-2 dehydrogenase/sirohydrochlorin ferrochelatase